MSAFTFAPAHDTGAILVTGGARGLGRGVTRALLDEGYRVVVADIAGEASEGAAFVAVDLADPGSIRAAIDRAIDLVGPLGGLVANAGIPSPRAGVEAARADVLDAVFEVNVRGTALVVSAVAEHLVAQGKGGAIVTMSSIGARQPTPGMSSYEASKAAVEALTRSAALELAADGIRVNAVAPGPVATPMTDNLRANAEALAAWERRIPLGRIAEIDDVVPAVVFLLSPLARHITGATITVDGGQLLT